jgi:hypothetical protein
MRREIDGFSRRIARLDLTPSASVGRKFRDRPAFADIGAGCAGVLEQDMIEHGAFHLDGFRLAIEFALAENEPGADRAVASSNCAPNFLGKPAACNAGSTPISRKMAMLHGSSDSPMWKRGKISFSRTSTRFARARQKRGGAAAAGTATDYQNVVTGD